MTFAPERLLPAPDLTLPPYTRAEFLDAVLALKPRVAVFDCDGTLWSGDAGSAFMHWTVETGLLAPEKVAWLKERYDGYLAGRVNELQICGEMVQVYAGLRESDLRAAAKTFFADHIEHYLFPELRELISSLQRAGTEIWAVSSTNYWVIEEGIKCFDIAPQHVLAARVEVINGTAAERLLDVPTDEGKVRALVQAGIAYPDTVFGNSVHDAAMLAIAQHAFPVNPTAALVERSHAEGWRVYLPEAVRGL